MAFRILGDLVENIANVERDLTLESAGVKLVPVIDFKDLYDYLTMRANLNPDDFIGANAVND